MTLRAMGPYNGTLPLPTKVIQAFLRDPSRMAFLRYTQYIPAPGVEFSYMRVDPDEAVRLVDLNASAWGYDDYAPTGNGFTPRAEMLTGRIGRNAFPYTIGDQTVKSWQNGGVNPQELIDKMRMQHAMLHRAVRVVTALQNAVWGSANSGTPQSLLGTAAPVYFDQSSGQEMIGGAPNPNYQIIKKTLQRIKRRINLSTNGMLTGDELIWVIPPVLAEALSTAGEIYEALKQSQYAGQLMNPTLRDWNLPPTYAGFTIVVEDTPRCLINMNSDGTTVADVTVSAQKDYILSSSSSTSYIVSRPGGLDGLYGGTNYSTVQIYTLNGEAQVKAFPIPLHELTQGRISIEDAIVIPALISGFQLNLSMSSGL